MGDTNDSQLSRRRFLANGAAGLAMLGLPEWFAKDAKASEAARIADQPKKFGPNDQINLACIGPGGKRGGFQQGLNDTRWAGAHEGVKVVAICDVDKMHRDDATAVFGADCKGYDDFRELLARKDIDAVVIGTPDHWHATVAAAAMRAGKDVYCEKPMTLTINEGRRLVQVAKETKRVFQVGSQQRSDGRFRMACELVRNGRIGKITHVNANLPGGPQGGPFEVKPVPSDFNFDMWLGPTPLEDYMPERTHGNFRHWLAYSGGMMTDWGAHHNDIAQWGLGMDDSGPIVIEGMGSRKVGKNCFNAFYDFQVTYTYANGTTLTASNHGENGVEFQGENGTIFVSRETIKASDQKLLDEPLPANAVRLYESNDHVGNFIDCIRTRKQTICPAEVGYRSSSVCHLGNISMRLEGRRLEWDPKRAQFVNDKDANAMLQRPKRGGWKV